MLGEAAEKFVDDLEGDRRIHQHADRILAVTKQEMELGLMGPLQDRAHFDKIYGGGGLATLT